MYEIKYYEYNGNLKVFEVYRNGLILVQRFPSSVKTELRYQYNQNGDISSITRSSVMRENKKIYLYDDKNRKIQTIGYNGTKMSFIYDDNNNLIKQIRGDRYTIQYEYDENGNETLMKSDRYFRITKYNMNGQPISYIYGSDLMEDKQVEENIVYDNVGRILYQKNSAGLEFWYFYDNRGNLNRIENSQGKKKIYQYDKNCNLIYTKDYCGTETSYILDSKQNIIFTEEKTVEGNISITKTFIVDDKFIDIFQDLKI